MKRTNTIAILISSASIAVAAAVALSWWMSLPKPKTLPARPPTSAFRDVPPWVGRPERPTTGPTTGPVRLVLADVPALRAEDHSPDEWARMWPAFAHAPFESSGFNAVMLPFLFGSTDGKGDPAEANAFSFLLSDDLDWSAASYCARHAYFVFKRDRARVEPLRYKTDEAQIRQLVADWRATHAIGGILVHSPAGYSGTLQVFGPDGRPVHEKEFAEPRPYFDLLGDMGAEVMRYFKDPPSDALARHLHRPRCKRPESLVMLGKAAFADRQSGEEFGLYQDILAADPDFAEVRAWWANQRWWADRDRGAYELQKALSLQSGLTKAALFDFEAESCPDPDLAAKYPQWVAGAEALVGPDHPLVLTLRLRDAMVPPPFVKPPVPPNKAPPLPKADPTLLPRALKAAGRYPNWGNLTPALIDMYAPNTDEFKRLPAPADADLAASLAVADIQSRFLPGSGGHTFAYIALARSMDWLGRPDLAAEAWGRAASDATAEGNSPVFYRAMTARGDALMRAGRFDEAIEAYRPVRLATEANVVRRMQATHGTAAAATLAGRASVVDELTVPAGAERDMAGLIPAWRACAHGRPPPTDDVAKVPADPTGTGQYTILLAAELDLARGGTRKRESVAAQLRLHPSDRLAAVVFDQYERREHDADADGFYDMLDWFHPEDPWAVKAVADWRARTGGKRPALDPAAVRRQLDDPRTQVVDWRRGMLPPWAVAAAVCTLASAGDDPAAEALARRYLDRLADVDAGELPAWANHMMRRVEQSRAARSVRTPGDVVRSGTTSPAP